MKYPFGFKAYFYYINSKIHFTNSNFDITGKQSEYLKNKLLKSWNSGRAKKDGKLFSVIEKSFNTKKDLVFLYASYQIKLQKDFYITEILNDEFKVFTDNLKEINNFSFVIQHSIDLLKLESKRKKTSIKKLLIANNEIPEVFKIVDSFNALTFFDYIFKISLTNENKRVNILNEERWKNVQNYLKKYKLILETYIDFNGERKKLCEYLR